MRQRNPEREVIVNVDPAEYFHAPTSTTVTTATTTVIINKYSTTNNVMFANKHLSLSQQFALPWPQYGSINTIYTVDRSTVMYAGVTKKQLKSSHTNPGNWR
jgi:hypothetical protein